MKKRCRTKATEKVVDSTNMMKKRRITTAIEKVVDSTNMMKNMMNKRCKVDSHISVLDLPVYVLYEIFCRLQIKDIIRCKSVCTAWYNNVIEPAFSEWYRKNSMFRTFLQPSNRGVGVLSLLEFSENGDCHRTLIHNKLGTRKIQYLSLIGSSNGFICWLEKTCPRLYYYDTSSFKRGRKEPELQIIHVTNPITGNSIQLPRHKDSHLVNYHFGSSLSGNTFKVLRMSFATDWKLQNSKIFTVGVDNRWRRLSVFFDVCWWNKVIACNGALHWIPFNESPVISTFDLAEEKLGKISEPPGIVLDRRHTQLGVFDNQLSLIDNTNLSHITIWTMKKYAIADTWTKIVVFRDLFPSDFQWYNFIPVADLQDGKILFENARVHHWICCDTKHNRSSDVDLYGPYDKIPMSDMEPYTPSFSSRILGVH